LISICASSYLYAAQDPLDSNKRTPAAIYQIWTVNNGKFENIYVGQVRRTNSTIDDMVKARADEHSKREDRFVRLNKQWDYAIIASSDGQDTYNAQGWTALEASLNEQAAILNQCEIHGKLFNKRNQLSSKDIINNWVVSQSKGSSLLGIAKDKNGKPVAITVEDKCLTK